MSQALEKIKSLLQFKYRKKYSKRSMNHNLTRKQAEEINDRFIPALNNLSESEVDKGIEDERLKLEIKKKDAEIIQLRKGHSNFNPSIYIQNSHSSQTTNCLKVPKDTLLIFLGASGIESMFGHELELLKPKVMELLKKPIENKSQMDRRLQDLREELPMLTFHYSDYFGIKPIGDSKRKKCIYNTTESYYDHIYSDPAVNNGLRGLTTLEQFKDMYYNKTKWNSLDISPYHTQQKLRDISNKDVSKIKENIPYFDIRIKDSKIRYKFNTIDEICNYYFTKDYTEYTDTDTDKYKNEIFKIMDYRYPDYKLVYMDWETIKISELFDINGPGIYIHYACRPFSDNFEGRAMIHPTRANSLNTLNAAHCPIKTEIYEIGYENKIIGKYNGCDNLKKVTIGKNVTEISNGAFALCYNLSEVIFEKVSKLNKLGSNSKGGCFLNCTRLTKIEIPDSVTEIGPGTFKFCSLLEKIKLPDNLKKISFDTFRDCKLLYKINFPNNLESIEKNAFLDCKLLDNLIFPNEIKNINIHITSFKNTNLRKISFYSSSTINNNPIDHPDNKKLFPRDCEIEILTQATPSISSVFGRKKKKKKQPSKKKKQSSKKKKQPSKKKKQPSKKKKQPSKKKKQPKLNKSFKRKQNSRNVNYQNII